MRQKSVLSIALLVIALAIGCAKKPDDAALVTNIKSQMFSDAQLKDASLQVISKDGQVTLSGTVPNDAARYEAYKIATQTPGVSKVNDQMAVQQAQTTELQSAPAALPPAAKVADVGPPKKARVKKHRDPRPVETTQDIPPAAPEQQYQPPPDQPLPAPPPPPAPHPPAPAALPPPPPPPQPKPVTVAAGSTVTIRMIDGVDSSVNTAGEIFHASLDAPLVVDDQVVVPKGADVYVR